MDSQILTPTQKQHLILIRQQIDWGARSEWPGTKETVFIRPKLAAKPYEAEGGNIEWRE